MNKFSSVSHSWLTLCHPMDCSTPGLPITDSRSLLKLMSIESVMPSNHLILCHPLLLLPSIFPSIRIFSSESVLSIRWPTYQSFSISPSNEYSELIYFRIDWFDLLAVQGTLKSLLQHRSSKASILERSAFFMVKLSHPYITPGKSIVLTVWIFVSKVMYLLPKVLSRFAITFLPRDKCLLISWLKSPSVAILETRKINSLVDLILVNLILVLQKPWNFTFCCHCFLSTANEAVQHFAPVCLFLTLVSLHLPTTH